MSLLPVCLRCSTRLFSSLSTESITKGCLSRIMMAGPSGRLSDWESPARSRSAADDAEPLSPERAPRESVPKSHTFFSLVSSWQWSGRRSESRAVARTLVEHPCDADLVHARDVTLLKQGSRDGFRVA